MVSTTGGGNVRRRPPAGLEESGWTGSGSMTWRGNWSALCRGGGSCAKRPAPWPGRCWPGGRRAPRRSAPRAAELAATQERRAAPPYFDFALNDCCLDGYTCTHDPGGNGLCRQCATGTPCGEYCVPGGDLCCGLGVPCTPPNECWDVGLCVSPCPSGTSRCGNRCCPDEHDCRNGVCSECPRGWRECGARCCGGNDRCVDGAFCTPCPDDTVPCGGTCCAIGDECVDGGCRTSCPAGATRCGSACCGAGQICENGSASTAARSAPSGGG